MSDHIQSPCSLISSQTHVDHHDVQMPESVHEQYVPQQCFCENAMFAAYCNIPIDFVQSRKSSLRPTATAFDDILIQSYRVAQNVTGDGNCYFRCLSLYFFGTEDFHSQIRKTIVDFMITHINVFSRDIHESNRCLTVNEYINSMSLTNGVLNSWATDIEIEVTATKLVKRS